MRLIGLTGSIGMGKSATAAMFRSLGAPVFDADAAVHDIYREPAVPDLREHFSEAVADGLVDRAKLAALIVADPARLKRLEAIVHPLVGARRRAFLDAAVRANRGAAVLDVPLLFETGGEASVDVVAVVSAPADVQRTRVMARPGMTAEKFAVILAKQTPDVEKRRRAHFVIDTSRGFDYSRRQVASLLKAIGAA